MKAHKRKFIITATGMFFMSTTSVFAIEELDIKNVSLEYYSSRYSSDSDIKTYLIKKGVSASEYENYIKLSKEYRYSNEKKWEEIEKGSSIIDTILFSDNKIKKEYEKRLKENDAEDMAYNSIKKDLVNNVEYVLEIIKSNLSDEIFMQEVFKKAYGRTPTEKEKGWLKSEEDLKYALYSGEIGRELTEREYSLIQRGYGYSLLGLNGDEISEYLEYTKLRDLINPLKVMYYNSRGRFTKIHNIINEKYNINIYKVLDEKERLEIHLKCTKDISFDENKAYKEVIIKLKEKKLLSAEIIENMPDIDINNDSPIIQDIEVINPNNELKQNLKENNSNIRNTLLSKVEQLYSIQNVKYSNNLKNTHIYFKYKDKEVNTFIRMSDDGILYSDTVEELVKIINETLGSKTVFDIKETMMLIENKIKVSKNGLYDYITLDDFIKIYKEFQIDIYEKEITKTEEVIVDPSVEKNFVVLDLESESYKIYCNEKGKINLTDFKEILNKMKLKYMLTTNSIMILKDGKIQIVETNMYTKGFVEVKDIRLFFDKLEIKATINTIIKKEA